MLRPATGWNTWNYETMLSYVSLPEGLALNINFRPAVLGNPYDPDYFIDDIVVDKNKNISPLAHSIDGKYTCLRINNWKGNSIKITTAVVDSNIYILINPELISETKFYI
ncbi:MAG: hypothetical protein HC906_08920 [Bacteroidales bacterium]|nr:hypothetical protein [Bacteroidales bacterium]